MHSYTRTSPWRARAACAVTLAAAFTFGSCNTDEFLGISDPDIINPPDINSPEAAEGLRIGALDRLSRMTSGFESVIHYPGLLTDEFRSGDTFTQRDETDQRRISETNSSVDDMWHAVNRARTAANQAIDALRQFPPPSSPVKVSDVGQMFWVRGFAENAIAENYCNGTPLSSFALDGSVITYGTPETNVQIYTRALQTFDSATTNTAADARGDTVRILARLARGRTLLNLGRYAEASAAIGGTAGVPTTFRYFVNHQETITDAPVNQIWALNNSGRRYVVGNGNGGGIDFATANDPRIPICQGGDATCRSFGVTQANSFDNNFGTAATRIGGRFYVQLVWPSRDSDVAIATGLEARLIEAEAALNAGDAVTWLATLNTLRASFQSLKQPSNPSTGTLAPLLDPGTQAGREDLMLRERAFWLFATGHRLTDMRRLSRPTSAGGYGRDPETVFPRGPFFKGGTYGTDVNVPVPEVERRNPNFTGCLDRNP